MEYLKGREMALLQILSAGENRSSETIAKEIGISGKTVRTIIKSLSSFLENYGARIEAKRGYGYSLHITDYDLFNSLFEKSATASYVIPESQEERSDYLIYRLFSSDSGISLNELCDELYITPNTFKADLKRVEEKISKYNLRIIKDPSRNTFKITGNEFNLRLCASNLLYDYTHENDFEVLSGIVLSILDQYQFKMSDIATEQFIKHLQISIMRIQHNHIITIPIAEEEDNDFEGYEFEIANLIADKISERYNIVYPLYELQYLVIHLMGKRLYGNNDGTVIIDEEIERLISDIFEIIKQTFNYDFTRDLELKVSLYYHFRPMINRLKYGMSMKNPLLKRIKEKYALAYVMATVSSTVIGSKYDRILSEDEIGYIALSFQLSMDKSKEKRKKNILLVCYLGKVSSELLKYHYLEIYADYINQIELCSVYDLKNIDLTAYDYIFTTVPIVGKYPLPIIEVKYFAEDDDIKRIRKAISTCNVLEENDFFPRELFYTDLTVKSKEEAIKELCERAFKQKVIGKDYYQSVMDREKEGATDLCYLSAMPHPCECIGNRTCLCVGILKNAIKWKTRKVQLIFLIIISKEDKKKIQCFYQLVSKFLLNKAYVDRLIKDKNYDEFLNIMNLINKEIEKEID